MKIFCVLVALTLVACISIKTEYQAIGYYRLTQKPIALQHIESISGTLLVRPVNIDGEYDSDKLLLLNGDNQLQPYNYHRWATEVSEIATNFILNRYASYRAFSGGVVAANSMSNSDYILETRITEMAAHNSESVSRDSNFVNLKITALLVRLNFQKGEKSLLMQKTYSIASSRGDNLVTSIPPAYSTAFSTVCDEMLLDVTQAINRTTRK
jgi:ABC-type uncharacterized transport system auxiliary subunit